MLMVRSQSGQDYEIAECALSQVTAHSDMILNVAGMQNPGKQN